MEAILAEKAARTPAQQKISSALLYAKSGRFAAMLGKDPERQIKSLTKFDSQGRALVDIQGDMSQLGGTVEALGGAVVKTRANSQRAWMPLNKLEDLATNPAVRAVRQELQAMSWRADKPGSTPGGKFRTGSREDRVAAVQSAVQALNANPPKFPTFDGSGGAVNVGAATSEGDKAHAADHARNFFGVDGTGVKIGVLSDSDDFKENSIASGDLPADTVTVPGEDGRPGAGEGTAMMEIVHDVAPGAKLFFATAFTSPESFADNIRTLRNVYGCDVIIDDVIYFFESPYEDDIIAQAVNDVTASGGMYFSSAGNSGNFDDGTSGTWEGDFKPAGALATLPSGYTVHSFGNGAISNRVEDTPFLGGPLILHWSDPGTLALPASSNDYDLFVLDNDLRNVIVAATDIQDGDNSNGDDLAFEFLPFLIPGGFRVVIAAKPGAEVRAVRTVLFNGELGISTAGATYGHNSTVDGYGVAAVDSFEAGGGEFTAGPTTPVEVFSSDGPRRIFYRSDNTPINADKPGVTFASGGGSTRAKPDLSAADGVSTTLPPGSGLNPFFGTSAAAPHAGAVAGLLKSALPAKTPAQIRTALLSGALDIEAPGTDRNSGRGIVSAFNSLKNLGAKGAVNLRRGAVQVIPLGTDVVLPGGAAQVNVAIDNVGGAAATGVSATLTSSSPDVLILQGNSTYPNIAAESTGARNNTPFAFFVSPSAPCGSVLPFTVTVTFNGGRTATFSFSVQTGRISTTPSHFAYTGPVVPIPDSNPAGVDIPLSVAFAGGVSKVSFNIDGTACDANIGTTTVGVDHTWVGDLVFRLTAPNGTTTGTLFSRPGGVGNSGNNFCKTVLTDGAASSIQNVSIAQAPFTGTFSPAQPLSVFTGVNATGNWTLHAEDDALIDTGSVRAFSLDVSGFSCGP